MVRKFQIIDFIDILNVSSSVVDVALESAGRAKRRGGSETWCSFQVHVGPGKLQITSLVHQHHGFGHPPFLLQQCTCYDVGGLIAPHGDAGDTGHGMVDRQCTKACAIDVRSPKEFRIHLIAAGVKDETHQFFEKV